jgi:hypothetical protein
VACVPESCQVTAKDRDQVKALGCGLVVVSTGGVDQHIAPQDLALSVALPDRKSLPPAVRAALGTAYDQFDQALWREGFDEACKVLEGQARAYLKRWIKTGRIQLVTKKGPRAVTRAQIDRFTMGQLAEAFGQIVAKSQADSTVEQTLTTVNRDRNAVVHHKTKKRTESRLRANVGRHMWTIIESLKVMI